MAHNIVVQAYECSLQAYGHKLPHYVSLREEIIEKIRKAQQKLQKVENYWAEITNGLKENSAELKKFLVIEKKNMRNRKMKNVVKMRKRLVMIKGNQVKHP